MGSALNGFASCQDSFLTTKQKNVLAILGDPYDEGSFETNLAADKYFIFTPRESAWMKEISMYLIYSRVAVQTSLQGFVDSIF